MRHLAGESPEAFGAGALKAAVLATEYRRSWETLRRLYAGFAPDVVVHFGLSQKIKVIHVERVGRNVVDPAKPDAAGYAPRGRARRTGPQALASSFAAPAIVAALAEAGFPAALSDDAGAYVCNATLYRSLAANAAPQVGFVHVPPLRRGGWTAARLREAGSVVLCAAVVAAPA
jgi:pyroglutamyl-peptidase